MEKCISLVCKISKLFRVLRVNLNLNHFLEARADIEGPPEKHLKLGSGLLLHCVVLQSTEPPSFVFW